MIIIDKETRRLDTNVENIIIARLLGKGTVVQENCTSHIRVIERVAEKIKYEQYMKYLYKVLKTQLILEKFETKKMFGFTIRNKDCIFDPYLKMFTGPRWPKDAVMNKEILTYLCIDRMSFRPKYRQYEISIPKMDLESIQILKTAFTNHLGINVSYRKRNQYYCFGIESRSRMRFLNVIKNCVEPLPIYDFVIKQLHLNGLNNYTPLHNEFIKLTRLQHDVVVGTLLGDATLTVGKESASITFDQNIVRKAYIEHLYTIFKDITNTPPKKITTREEYYVKTLRNPSLYKYYKAFYMLNDKKVEKRLPDEFFQWLNPCVLAYWVVDDGSYSQDEGSLVLCTNSFTYDEHLRMQSIFEEKLGLTCTINKDRDKFRLRFSRIMCEKIFKMIDQYLITPCMRYKAGIGRV